MKNKKTTILGIMLIAGAVFTGAAQLISGQADFQQVLAAIGAALAGSGFLAAGDGGL